ncbi:putative L-selectin-like, partial [Triplophysa rosa]
QKKQIVRVEVKSGLNVNDAAVMETTLQWIKQKLKDRGIENDTRLTWRLQPDGNVFTPKHDRKAAAEEMDLKQEGCSKIYF